MRKRWQVVLLTTYGDGSVREDLLKKYRFRRSAQSSISWMNWPLVLTMSAYTNSLPSMRDEDKIVGVDAEVREL